MADRTQVQLDVKRPLPFYRRLALENKILLFLFLILIVLGGFAFLIGYTVLDRGLLDLVAAGNEPNDAFLRRSGLIVLGLMVLPLVATVLLARMAIRYAIHPLLELTDVADRISTGDLDARIDFGVKVHCWDIKNCQRPDCKAYMNYTQQCWYIDGTPCEGYEPFFPEKLAGCRTCEVYRAHRGDQIVRLADAFGHMTNALKTSANDLVKSVAFRNNLITNSFDGIVATDDKGIVTIFNRVAERLTGYAESHVVNRMSWETFFVEDLGKWLDKPLSYGRERRLRGFSPRESKLRRIDGDPVDVRIAGISLFERGIHLGNVLFFQDMREIKKLRTDLVASERLAATGQAAASISHSIRNILGGLQGGAYVFKRGRRKEDAKEMDTGWDMVERNVAIIADLVKDLLNFAKERTPQVTSVDLETLLHEVVRDSGYADDPRMRTVVDVPSDFKPVHLDPHAFHQALLNLVKNAAQAVDEDDEGLVTLSARRQIDRVIVAVSDNGSGMSPETVEKVRGGMYSTKGAKGTGLGLMVVSKIVQEHRGTLEIESLEGQGSTFRIMLPQMEIEPPADQGAVKSGDQAGAKAFS